VYSDPRHYIRSNWVSYSLWAVGAVDTRARLLDVEGALAGAYDPYAFIRTAYLQHREYKVHGGQSPSEEDQEQKMLEEAGEDQGTQSAPAPQSPPAQPPH
jgi:phospholipid-binding lipoprotein MlaA